MSIKLRAYLEETERSYNYRIKTVVPMDDHVMDRIERALVKYQPTAIGRVEKTIFQRHPLDFPGVENAEVYYIDVTTSLPASSYVLQQDIRQALGIPEKFIVVRGENEPTEVETARLNAFADMDADAEKRSLEHGATLNDADYSEGDDIDGSDYYGDKYNSRLTDYLAKIAAEREAIIVKTKNAPFAWLEAGENELSPKQDTTDFNASMKTKTGKVKADRSQNARGNFDDNIRKYKRLYQDKEGKTEVLSKDAVAVSTKK